MHRAPVAPLAAATEKRGFRSPLATCGGAHIPVPDERIYEFGTGRKVHE
jgi:hypothetical protein